MPPATPSRPRSTLLAIVLLWIAFYASFTLFTPPLLDDADSVHAEVAREMLLRHDYVTLYANGIRYLEKAPLLYWSMAASMRVSQLFGATSPRSLAVAARIPLALCVLGLVLLVEAFARRLYRSHRAGLYAALILLSSFGIFLFTRITIPDAGVCLFTTLAIYAFYRTEEAPTNEPPTSPGAPGPDSRTRAGGQHLRLWCGLFAAACALNVLTKGLIGVVFPVAIVAIYLWLTRGLRGSFARLRQLHPIASVEAFLLIAAPWHILAGLANPTQGHPAAFHFINGHWQIPLPTDGNVRGWFWFYFMNEHLLRYLNLRVPHDYDTAPLWLFWGLCFVWMMPWSAFAFKAAYRAMPFRSESWREQLRRHELSMLERGRLLLLIAAAFVLIFFSLSTRQEYYVLPALPAVAILIAGWLDLESRSSRNGDQYRAAQRIIGFWLFVGIGFTSAVVLLLMHSHRPPPRTELASLLQQNPGDYALSMGHFLDLNANSLGLFRFPLVLAALGFLGAPLGALLLRRNHHRHGGNLALAAGAFVFLLAAHIGLQTFSPVLTSAQLAQAIAKQRPGGDLIVIHGEFESGSTLAFYLQRPDNWIHEGFGQKIAPDTELIHILEGRSSNLWYGSFFPDAPDIFETPQSIAAKWPGPQRIFLWQSLTDPPNQLPTLPGPVYILVKSGGKEIVSNRPNR
jgi:4-amino-4-deoxy-L-arabinose transferase-like glycosyltransferase